MLFKCICLLFLLALINLNHASIFRGNGKGQSPDMCEYANITWKKGTEVSHPTKCCKLACHEDLTFTGYCCGAVMVTPEMCLKEDKSLPYPDCCPQPVLCTEKNKQ